MAFKTNWQLRTNVYSKISFLKKSVDQLTTLLWMPNLLSVYGLMIMFFAAQFNCIVRCDASRRASQRNIAILVAHPIRGCFVLSFRCVQKPIVRQISAAATILYELQIHFFIHRLKRWRGCKKSKGEEWMRSEEHHQESFIWNKILLNNPKNLNCFCRIHFVCFYSQIVFSSVSNNGVS